MIGISIDGNEILFYNLHLPTPRMTFQELRGNGFLHSAVTRVFSAKVRSRFNSWIVIFDWPPRSEAATSEDLPVILAGDFNA